MKSGRRHQRRALAAIESAFSPRQDVRTLATAQATMRFLRHNKRSFQERSLIGGVTARQNRQHQHGQHYEDDGSSWGALAALLSASTIATYTYGDSLPSFSSSWQDDSGEWSCRKYWQAATTGILSLGRIDNTQSPSAHTMTSYSSIHKTDGAVVGTQNRLQQPDAQYEPRRIALNGDEQASSSSCLKEKLSDKYQVDWNAIALGRGAYGTVHLAFDKVQNRAVAVKRISDRVAFERETKALLRVQRQGGNAHMLTLRDVYEDGQSYYLVLDLAHGGEVFYDLVEHGPYTQAQAAGLVLQLATTLEFLHSKIKMVHGDLKPENLLLKHKNREYNDLALIDFGCSVALDEEREVGGENSLHCSGTFAYWPPERFRNDATATPAMDMWSVGVILFIFLTGKHPFDPDGICTDEELHQNILNMKATPRIAPLALTMQNNDDAWASAQDLINRLLEVDPNQRLTAKELMQHPWVQQQQHMINVNSPSSPPLGHANNDEETLSVSSAVVLSTATTVI